VEFITISRIIATFIFISIAFMPKFQIIAVVVYLYGICTDLIDGYLARKFGSVTNGGQTLDILSDQYMTIISIVYLLFKDTSLFPCIFIIFRELFLLSFRKYQSLFPPNRFIGGIIAGVIWLLTLLSIAELINYEIVNLFIWALSIFVTYDLFTRIRANWKILVKLFTN
jgi:phosphatidylglycerophosphate synthase